MRGPVPEFDPLASVDSLLEIITLAHAAIYTVHRRLIDLDADDEESRPLLQESVEIVFSKAPEVGRRARVGRRMGGLPTARSLAAPSVLAAAEKEAAHAERALRRLLRRQEEVATRLRSRLDEAVG